MLHEYMMEKFGEQNRKELQEWFENERKRHEALQAQPRLSDRLRLAIGTQLITLGAALVRCEELTRTTIERTTMGGRR